MRIFQRKTSMGKVSVLNQVSAGKEAGTSSALNQSYGYNSNIAISLQKSYDIGEGLEAL